MTNFAPGCSCSINADTPNESCWVHGWPNTRQCPQCGQMRGNNPCKRCGNGYGLSREAHTLDEDAGKADASNQSEATPKV
jgi:hypothetical protein